MLRNSDFQILYKKLIINHLVKQYNRLLFVSYYWQDSGICILANKLYIGLTLAGKGNGIFASKFEVNGYIS